MNIREDYVSFGTAKLLKEKGFDENTNNQYPTCGIHYGEVGEYNITDRSRNPENYIPAPTLQMAMKWLREVHNLCIELYRTACGYFYTISTIPDGSCKCEPKEGDGDDDSGQWTTYEDACEAAIKYCLENLIK